jgi:hypothetical protein
MLVDGPQPLQPLFGRSKYNFMITADGYSKDPSIMPEGIVITWGKDMIDLKGGLKNFLSYFKEIMLDEDTTWLQKCKNAPKHDIIHVYIIVANRLYAKGFYGGYDKGKTIINTPSTGKSFSRRENIEWPRIIIAGPIEYCPFKRTLKGFQGFRYCTKLF